MKKLYIFFKTLNWFQKLMVLVIALLSTTFILRAITPTQVPLQSEVLQNITNNPVNLQNIEFRGSAPTIPENLPLATAVYKEVKEELLQSLLTTFSIPSTKTPDGSWENDEFDILELTQPTGYSLSRISNFQNSNNKNIDTDTAITEATKIVDGLYSFGSKPSVIASEIEILNDEPGELDSNSTELFIKIPFSFTIQGVPIFVEQDTQYAATIILDSSYILQKAWFRPYTIESSQGRNYRTVNINEAMGRVNQNQAAIVFYRYDGPNAADFSKISSGILNQATIEYRLDSATNTIVPYYKLSGNIKNSAGYDIETALITPAVKTNFSQE